jgi:tetratricopeptide (TPR) repeat protein
MRLQKWRALILAAAGLLTVVGLWAQVVIQRREPLPAPCSSKIEAACEQFAKGVEAHRRGQFQAAAFHFRNAVAIDPVFNEARIYLGVALAQQYIPGGEAPENMQLGKSAIAAFQEALEHDAENRVAIASIAQLYYNMKDFQKARDYQRRRLTLDPEDPEPYYWIGVINWAVVYPRRQELRKTLNIATPPDPAKPGLLTPLPESARVELAEQNLRLVEEGIEALEKAIELQPDHADAMTYLNLLYRERADLQADEVDRQEDLEKADSWVQKALQVMRKKQTLSQPASTD